MENTENNNKKKAIVGLTIGIISLIILIGGAAYAYWTANTSINFNTATITYETGDEAIVILNGTSAELTLGTLTPDDMAKLNNNTAYYASATGKKTTFTEETIGIASLSEDDINAYRCSFSLSLSHSGSADLIDRFLSETNGEPDYANRSAGQIILTVNGVEYDLNDGFPSTINGFVTTNNIDLGKINVSFKFVNLSDVNQTYLANSNGIISIDVVNNSFNCEVIGHAEHSYWAWEYTLDDNNNTIYTTYSNTAKNKVTDYNDLNPYYILRYNYTSQTSNNYESLESCQADLDNYNDEGSSYDGSQAVCVNNDSTYEIVYPNGFDYSLFMSESECEENLEDYDNNQHAICEELQPKVFVREYRYPTGLASTDNNYYSIYYEDSTIYESLQDCQDDSLEDDNAKCMTTDLYSLEFTVAGAPSYDTLNDCLSNLQDGFCEYDAESGKYLTYRIGSSTISEAVCNSQVSTAPPFIKARCAPSNYKIKGVYTAETFSTEADCNDYIQNNDYEDSFCEYDNDNEEFVIIRIPDDLFSVNACNSIIQSEEDDDWNLSCVITDNHPYVKRIPTDYQSYDTIDDCLNNLNNIIIPVDMAPVCDYKYDVGEMVYYDKSEICGLINNNLLCYPANSSVNQYNDIMSSVDVWDDSGYDVDDEEYYYSNDDFYSNYYGSGNSLSMTPYWIGCWYNSGGRLACGWD